MTDLAEYFSDKEEIIRLNNQIDMIAGFYHRLYKGQINKLKKSLDVQYSATCKYKVFAGMMGEPRKRELAIELIRNKKLGLITDSFSEIAKKCGYSKTGIAHISCKLKVNGYS